MGKRFTATEKWTDPWFLSLDTGQKNAWLYLCDNCDAAGVIDLPKQLADFQIGMHVDWDGLIAVAGGRIEVIQKGKLWLTGFIEFQYGKLSEECSAHKPVFRLLAKYALTQRVLEGIQKGINTLKDKDKDKDKDKEQDKDKDKEEEGGMQGGNTRKRFVPPSVPEVEQYCEVRGNGINAVQFVDFYEAKNWMIGKNRMADWKAAVRNWERSNNPRGSPSGSDPRGNMGVLAGFISKGKTNGEP